jgi:hypothetical protein
MTVPLGAFLLPGSAFPCEGIEFHPESVATTALVVGRDPRRGLQPTTPQDTM